MIRISGDSRKPLRFDGEPILQVVCVQATLEAAVAGRKVQCDTNLDWDWKACATRSADIPVRGFGQLSSRPFLPTQVCLFKNSVELHSEPAA